MLLLQDEYDAFKKEEDKSRLIYEEGNEERKYISIMLPVVAHSTEIDHVQNIKFDINKGEYLQIIFFSYESLILRSNNQIQ